MAAGMITTAAEQRARARVPLRIHVNGTRGKSTTTRLIAGMLRAAGKATMAKVTGEQPLVIDAAGVEHRLNRIGPARIQEQAHFLRRAARHGAEAVVIECMALAPAYQEVSEKLIAAHLAVITNARLDHMEEMGHSRQEVARSLCGMIPHGGVVILGDPVLLPAAEAVARARNSRTVLADTSFHDSGSDAALTLARYVLQHVSLTELQHSAALSHLDRHSARTSREPAIIELNGYRTLDLFTVNDRDTFQRKWEALAQPAWLLYNHRADRPLRAAAFAALLGESRTRPIGIMLTGDPGAARMFRRKLAETIPLVRLPRPASWQQVTGAAARLHIEHGSLIIGCGNWKGAPRHAD